MELRTKRWRAQVPLVFVMGAAGLLSGVVGARFFADEQRLEDLRQRVEKLERANPCVEEKNR